MGEHEVRPAVAGKLRHLLELELDAKPFAPVPQVLPEGLVRTRLGKRDVQPGSDLLDGPLQHDVLVRLRHSGRRPHHDPMWM